MRKIILIAMAVMSLLSAEKVVTVEQICNLTARSANSIMYYRQDNKPMREVMKDFINEKNKDGWGAIYKDIIIDAYSQPRYMGEEYKEAARVDFENKWYLKCLKERK